MKEMALKWKWAALLLSAIGISCLGDFIYLIAINILVLDLTKSPAAIAGLYMIRPIATIFTSFWSGSIIDRFDQRKMMMFLDIFRGLFVACIPFLSSLWQIYAFVFFINMASSLFNPTSTVYITRLIPQHQRKQFNSFQSLIQSGSFLIGPALAGVLLLVWTVDLAIFVNAATFLLSGLLILFLPSLVAETTETSNASLSIRTLIEDWKTVIGFCYKAPYIILVYTLFQLAMVLTMALDSQEVSFIRQVLNLSKTDYGLLVSIAGAGYVAGALCNSMIVKYFSTRWLIGVGTLWVSGGYIIYSFSTSFLMVAVGFIVLAFFLAFANTGFLTFYQQNVPVAIMGRVSSALGMFQSLLQIACTFAFGVAAQMFSIQPVIIAGSCTMLAISIFLLVAVTLPSKVNFYESQAVKSKGI
jgi:predicted MFS family arabinose efflux permease